MSTSPSKRRWPWLLVAVTIIAAGAYGIQKLPDPESGTSAIEAPLTNTAAVVRGDLTQEESYDGTLESLEGETLSSPVSGVVSFVAATGSVVDPGEVLFEIDGEPFVVLGGTVPAYRDLTLGAAARTVANRMNGTLTWLASVGTVLEEGDVIARIDDRPVIVLFGETPVYRTLYDARTNLEGPDVFQLETALERLGFATSDTLTIDSEFTSSTANRVEDWQEAVGADTDGRIDLGEVVFLPGPAQVTSELSEVGSRVADGAPLVNVATGDQLSGADVLQLEEALANLGFMDAPNDQFDAATAAAITALQVSVGATPTGYLPAAAVLYSDLAVRVDSAIAGVGSAVSVNAPVIEVSSTELIVRIALPASDQGLLRRGTPVTVELPNGTDIPATVISVASVATRLQGFEATFEVVIALSDSTAAQGFEDSPVDVEVITDSVTDVLNIPVTSLIALAEGGYAVEVVENGTTRLVSVDPGFFARGMVEVSGELAVGDLVVVP